MKLKTFLQSDEFSGVVMGVVLLIFAAPLLLLDAAERAKHTLADLWTVWTADERDYAPHGWESERLTALDRLSNRR